MGHYAAVIEKVDSQVLSGEESPHVSEDQPTEPGRPDAAAGVGAKTFSERLDLLFAATHPANRGEVSYQEVVEAMANAGGPSVTPTYLYMLRTGRRANPRAELIQALARYFRVPAGYFLDDDVAEQFGEQLRLLQAIRDSGTAGLALRAQGLSPASREALAAIMDRLRAADGLPETDRGNDAAPDGPPSGQGQPS